MARAGEKKGSGRRVAHAKEYPEMGEQLAFLKELKTSLWMVRPGFEFWLCCLSAV